MSNTSKDTHSDTPAWARAAAFPNKPDSSPFGYLDTKGTAHPADSVEELVKNIRHARDGIGLVWTPESEKFVTPEEVPALWKPLRSRQKKLASRDLSDGLRMGAVFGIALIWTAYSAYQRSHGKLEALYSHQLTGLAALLLLIFGLLPLYEGWKLKRRLRQTSSKELANEIPEARFDAWLDRQSIPTTRILLGAIILVGVIQQIIDWSHPSTGATHTSIERAGLLKLADPVWWRTFTGPMLHGNIIHLLMNASGLLYLGRRVETLARWPHLTLVFLAAMWTGSLTTTTMNPNMPSVGISGGLMGLLGFLLVFEFLHPNLVPRPARRRLLAGLILMLVIGKIGMSFIDNAAHLGGLALGLGYAFIVFPRSTSPQRPQTRSRDRIVGGLSSAALIAITLLTITKLLSNT
ncbi:MAG: rhomboid family intramembrane serine protease [Akkermansiaceae bacterium]